MSKLLGAQCQMNTRALIDYCHIVRPRAAMGIMVQERSFYEELARLGVKGIYRHWPNFHWTDPERHAIEAAQTLKQETVGFRDLLTWVLGNNEEIHSFMRTEFDKADRFMLRFIEEVHDKLGIHSIVLNAACGHFRSDILSFPRTLAALDRCGECRLGLHEYDWPTMWRLYVQGLQEGNDGLWLCLKWKEIMRAIKEAGYHNIKCAITETGVDSGAAQDYPNKGWRELHPDINEARRQFLRCLLPWYYDALARDDDVDFALLFGAGLNGDWASFNLDTEIAHAIANYEIYPRRVRNG